MVDKIYLFSFLNIKLLMNRFILFIFFISTSFLFAMPEEDPSVSISVNDIIIVSDVDKVREYTKSKDLTERALEQIKLADDSYVEGVQNLQQYKIFQKL